MKLHIVVNPKYSYLTDFVYSIPAHFDSGGEVLNDDRNVIKRFHVNGLAVVVKRYKRPNWVQRISYSFFRKGKAERAYLYGNELLNRGFSTPESIAYIEHYTNHLLDYSYYLCLNDSSPAIRQEIKDVEEPNLVVLEDFAIFVCELHKRGILHHDLNCSNVLYKAANNGHYTFSLIDNNRMFFYPDHTMPPLDECLMNLTRFTDDMRIFHIVAEDYCKTRNLGNEVVDRLISIKTKRDIKWHRKKALLRKLKLKR